MKSLNIGSFESENRGSIDFIRGYDATIAAAIYDHAFDPGIVQTLGGKDMKRFAPAEFPKWVQKGGGRFMYTAWAAGHLAGLFWIGGEAFPSAHFPDSPLRPPYTAAWRTAYRAPESTPEHEATFQGAGIGKRLALAGIADAMELTQRGGPKVIENGNITELPPLQEAGLWLDTGVNNTAGQTLYHHLGNTARGQEPIGFTDIGIFTPPAQDGATALELEPRVGMIAGPETMQRFRSAAHVLINYSILF